MVKTKPESFHYSYGRTKREDASLFFLNRGTNANTGHPVSVEQDGLFWRRTGKGH